LAINALVLIFLIRIEIILDFSPTQNVYLTRIRRPKI